MMLDPDAVVADQEICEHASALAALVAHYYDTLRALGLPESLCVQVTVDWHAALISDSIAWEPDDES
jgi:hypothetical protein